MQRKKVGREMEKGVGRLNYREKFRMSISIKFKRKWSELIWNSHKRPLLWIWPVHSKPRPILILEKFQVGSLRKISSFRNSAFLFKTITHGSIFAFIKTPFLTAFKEINDAFKSVLGFQRREWGKVNVEVGGGKRVGKKIYRSF